MRSSNSARPMSSMLQAAWTAHAATWRVKGTKHMVSLDQRAHRGHKTAARKESRTSRKDGMPNTDSKPGRTWSARAARNSIRKCWQTDDGEGTVSCSSASRASQARRFSLLATSGGASSRKTRRLFPKGEPDAATRASWQPKELSRGEDSRAAVALHGASQVG